MMKRTLGIDPGTVRTGFAISDLLGITAQGLDTLPVKSEKQVIAHICELIKQYEVEAIVVGFPLNMDGSKGPSAERSEKLADKLRGATDCEVILWDERLTSYQAESEMIEFDVSRKKRKKAVDRMAAQLLLQSYMDSQSTS